MSEYRLGDIIDDYCVRCKRIMNHAVVSVLNREPAKVRCRTCHSDHDYRHEQVPPSKGDLRKAALFQEVLKTVSPEGAAAEAEAPSPIPAPIIDEAAEEAPKEEAPKAKAKTKGKGRK